MHAWDLSLGVLQGGTECAAVGWGNIGRASRCMHRQQGPAPAPRARRGEATSPGPHPRSFCLDWHAAAGFAYVAQPEHYPPCVAAVEAGDENSTDCTAGAVILQRHGLPVKVRDPRCWVHARVCWRGRGFLPSGPGRVWVLAGQDTACRSKCMPCEVPACTHHNSHYDLLHPPLPFPSRFRSCPRWAPRAPPSL